MKLLQSWWATNNVFPFLGNTGYSILESTAVFHCSEVLCLISRDRSSHMWISHRSQSWSNRLGDPSVPGPKNCGGPLFPVWTTCGSLIQGQLYMQQLHTHSKTPLLLVVPRCAMQRRHTSCPETQWFPRACLERCRDIYGYLTYNLGCKMMKGMSPLWLFIPKACEIFNGLGTDSIAVDRRVCLGTSHIFSRLSGSISV